MSEIKSPEDVLKLSLNDIPKEVAVPAGHWKAQVVSEPKIAAVSRDNPNALIAEMRTAIKLLFPADDVNSAELDGFNVAENGRGFFSIPLYNLGTDLHKVRRFTEALGVDTKVGVLEDWLKQSKGGTFITQAVHRQNKDDPEGLPRVDFKGYQSEQA